MDSLKFIKEHKIIAIVRYVSRENIVPMAQAFYDGGLRLVEVTFDQKRSDCMTETPALIKMLSEVFKDKMLIGAGTVLDTKQCDAAAESGAKYIISPNVDFDVIKRTKELGLVSMPGAMTPSEIAAAHKAGADIVKMFPMNNLGLDYLKAVRAPLSHIPLCAVGGVNPGNAKSFIEAGMVGIGVGGNLVDVKAIEAGDFDKIKSVAKQYYDALN